MMRRVTLLLAGFLLALPCLAENYAMLVGVRQVKAAKPSPVLEGIANDLELGREIAQRLGVADRNTLVFSDTGAGRPATRPHVETALQTLLEQTRPGDFVLLYLSGHGVQQPSPIPDITEPDRLDEVFLLEDSQPWEPGKGIVNGLTDKEIRRWLAALDSKRVVVWMVADTCHAGGIARALREWPDGELLPRGYKGLRPIWLGVKNWLRKGTAGAPATEDVRVRASAFTHVSIFMAADKAGNALEVELRRDGRKVGLFTWALNRAVMRSPLPVTVEQLAQETLAQYRDYPAWVVRPVFEAAKQNSVP